MRANISIYELARITSQCELIVQTFSQPSPRDKTFSYQKVSSKSSSPLEYVVNDVSLEYNTLFHPFLLIFEIFNYNVHNCLVDFGAFVNVMSLFVAKEINAKWDKTNVEMDRSLVQDIGELKNVPIRLSKDDQVHQCINIVIVDIPKAYGVLLSRD